VTDAAACAEVYPVIAPVIEVNAVFAVAAAFHLS
jgi:hypothetical protein